MMDPTLNYRVRAFSLGRAVLWSGLAGVGILAGCTVHDHEYHREREVYVPQPSVREEVVVQQPVQEVAYEPAPPEVVSVYDHDLSPYGHWVRVSRYGRCWVYDRRPSNWRPYTVGHWVYTDQGYVWVAEGDEAAWGETCYHYGRWYEDPQYGWVWVPGRTWGPSWVAWREGGGYCGWAPLSPECRDGDPVDVVVVDRYVPRDRYYCVEERYIGEPRVYEHVTYNNVTIINRTTNITNITYVNNVVVNRGVSSEHVARYSGHPVREEHVARASSREEAQRMVASGHPVLYSPPALESYALTHPIQVRNSPRRDNPDHAAQARPLPREERIAHNPEVHVEAPKEPRAEHRTEPVHTESPNLRPRPTEQPGSQERQPMRPKIDAHATPAPKPGETETRVRPNRGNETPKSHVETESRSRTDSHADPKTRAPNEPKRKPKPGEKPDDPRDRNPQ